MNFIRPCDHKSPRAVALIVGVLGLIAILRLVSAYFIFSQAYDEPAHIACGMEWLDKGTFVFEPLHPPLPRVAAAIGPYLAGVRLPPVGILQDAGGQSYDIYSAGNEILNMQGHYRRNLILAHLGELPFFCLAMFLVFVWSRSVFGAWPAVLAVLLFTTLPPILAFAGLAYVDFSLAVFLPLTLFTFTRWLDSPTWRRSLTQGLTVALAVLSNFTALLFLPVCLFVITLCWWHLARRSANASEFHRFAGAACVTVLMALFVIWGGYRFSVKPLNQVFTNPVQDIAAMKGAPAPFKHLALRIVDANLPLPAPQLLKGIVAAWVFNKTSPTSYAIGKIRRGGFWYFYWLDLGLKTPVSFLLLAVPGVAWAFISVRRHRNWHILAPAASALAILLVAMTMKVNLGIRHILFIYPLLAVISAGAASSLWQLRARWFRLGPTIVLGLVAWQVFSAAAVHPDYIAYFNEFGGSHPERFLLFGCDLDCGQDVQRLSRTLRDRGISHVSLRLWTSADLTRMKLPDYDTLAPYQRSTGWIAVSLLHIRSGEEIWDRDHRDGYSWLDSYRPVAVAGKTIRLYYIPKSLAVTSRSSAGSSSGASLARPRVQRASID